MRRVHRWVIVFAALGVALGQEDDASVGEGGEIQDDADSEEQKVPALTKLDCASDFDVRMIAWTAAKRKWCCKNENVGCVDEFDCETDKQNSRKGWSTEKKNWCCGNKNIACEFDCTAGLDKADIGWSLEKKAWCCQNQSAINSTDWSVTIKKLCQGDAQAGESRSNDGIIDNKSTNDSPTSGSFGPKDCVRVSRTEKGTCMLTTSCANQNLSSTEFAFVCLNPGTSLPHALHSYGRGGFDEEEQFDSGVKCDSCMTVATAFQTGGLLVRNAMRSLPQSMVPQVRPEETGSSAPVTNITVQVVQPVSNGTAAQILTRIPANSTLYGPPCVATFRSPMGTCIIQTRCVADALAQLNIGITCVEKGGNYARYMFGKGIVASEELFDSGVECDTCLGAIDGDDPIPANTTTVISKSPTEDAIQLRSDVSMLREQVRALMEAMNATTVVNIPPKKASLKGTPKAAPKVSPKAPPKAPPQAPPRNTPIPTPRPTRVPLPPPAFVPTPAK